MEQQKQQMLAFGSLLPTVVEQNYEIVHVVYVVFLKTNPKEKMRWTNLYFTLRSRAD